MQAVHESNGHAGIIPTRRRAGEAASLDFGEQNTPCPAELWGWYNTGRRGQRVEGLTIRSTVPRDWEKKKGERYLLVLVDFVSGHVVISPVRKATGNSVISMLEQVCSRLGLPKELGTENGTFSR